MSSDDAEPAPDAVPNSEPSASAEPAGSSPDRAAACDGEKPHAAPAGQPDASTSAARTFGDAPTSPLTAPVPAAGPHRYGLAARFMAELFGTFVIVFTGVSVAVFSVINGANSITVAAAFGLAIIGAGYAVGAVSGGHFNPAVTLGAAIAGRTRWGNLLPYWIAQVLGGLGGAAVISIVVREMTIPGLKGADASAMRNAMWILGSDSFGKLRPELTQKLGITSTVGAYFPQTAAILVETILTAILVFVVLGASSRRFNAKSAPIAIGLTFTALMLVAIPVTNGSLNPARATASAVFAGGQTLSQLWVFWVSGLLGGAIAGFIFPALSSFTDNDLALDEASPR